jgi:mannose/fructose/N-acetylgalactosamine-specific phosphotransferase system component IIB
MSLELLRIDDRLLHGQVLVGWGARLGIAYYAVVDDALAESAWEQELYGSALPQGVEVEFLSVEEATRRFEELDARPDRGALLTRGTGAMRALAEAGHLEGRRVNVGGLHDAPGRGRVLDYVYLGTSERADLAAIARRAGTVSARDLPTAAAVPLEKVLGT